MLRFSLSHHKLKSAAAILFWLLLWQIIAFFVGLDLLLPSPISVMQALWGLLFILDFYLAIGFSLLGILSGFLLGVLGGTLIGLLCFRFSLIHALCSPILRLMRTAPVASFIILALLWFGRNTVPMLISAMMVLPIVVSSTQTALTETDQNLLEMASVYRFSRGKTIRLIYLPQVLPQWQAACVLGMGLAWKAGVAAEVIAQPTLSMGRNLYRSRLLLNTPELFAWTAIVILLSFLLERLFSALMQRLGGRYRL